METTKPRTVFDNSGAAVLAAAVGLAMTIGARALEKIPGEWFGWLLQCWGMA
jgi:hypothetical protein